MCLVSPVAPTEAAVASGVSLSRPPPPLSAWQVVVGDYNPQCNCPSPWTGAYCELRQEWTGKSHPFALLVDQPVDSVSVAAFTSSMATILGLYQSQVHVVSIIAQVGPSPPALPLLPRALFERDHSPLPPLPHKWTYRGPKAALGEGPPTAGMGVSARTHVANGEGRCPPPCGPDTEQWNRDSLGAMLAQSPERKEGGVRGSEGRPDREIKGTFSFVCSHTPVAHAAACEALGHPVETALGAQAPQQALGRLGMWSICCVSLDGQQRMQLNALTGSGPHGCLRRERVQGNGKGKWREANRLHEGGGGGAGASE